MASNSLREKILTHLVTTIEAIPSIHHVERRFPKDETQLSALPVTVFPFVALMGGLPQPQWQSHHQGIEDIRLISELPVRINLYGHAPYNPDEVVSSLLDDLWQALLSDTKRGHLAMATLIQPDPEVYFVEPYILFSLMCRIRYVHGTQGV